MKLSVVMIVKNEEKHLDTCLKSVKGVDEIIVLDTGSVDNTIEVAKTYTSKVYNDYRWRDNFSEARNHALGKATGDWVLSIDADEELMTPVKDVKKIIEKADKDGVKAIDITQYSGSYSNKFPRIFKKCPEVYWSGAIHNHLSVSGQADSDIKIRYGYSSSHDLDPERTLRILLKEVEKGGRVRELYYLAREYWYRNENLKAIYWLKEYIEKSTYLAEKADAYLMLAKCYWALKKGEQARVNCLMALNINANFKEAIEFMAVLAGKGSGNSTWEKNAQQWENMAKTADNSNVIFIRNAKS
jgi:glycosyltransferase involved in cell wall biosynthesis